MLPNPPSCRKLLTTVAYYSGPWDPVMQGRSRIRLGASKLYPAAFLARRLLGIKAVTDNDIRENVRSAAAGPDFLTI